MQRFVNNPDYVVEDMLKGFLKAHDEDVYKRQILTPTERVHRPTTSLRRKRSKQPSESTPKT